MTGPQASQDGASAPSGAGGTLETLADAFARLRAAYDRHRVPVLRLEMPAEERRAAIGARLEYADFADTLSRTLAQHGHRDLAVDARELAYAVRHNEDADVRTLSRRIAAKMLVLLEPRATRAPRQDKARGIEAAFAALPEASAPGLRSFADWSAAVGAETKRAPHPASMRRYAKDLRAAGRMHPRELKRAGR